MLKIRNLSINYHSHQVLKDIDLELEPQNVYGLIGTNGCGKTSILNAIARFIKYSGEINIDNKPIHSFGRKQLAKKIVYMRQNTNINFSYSVQEIVNMSQYSHDFSQINKEYIDKIMNVCELHDIRDKNILKLSGGQRQRVFFAKTLAQDSDIILIDEGFSSIDIYYQIKFMNYLHELSRERKKTILVVIHDINFALKSIDQVIVFDDCKVYDRGKPEKVINKKMMKDVFKVDIDISKYGIDYKI